MTIKIELFSIVTGILSLVGSFLLICTILRSKKKLSVPYRRIIFGTSVYDVFQSLGLATSIFLSPKYMEPPKEWAIGNSATCDIQGFFTTVGAIGVPLYLCSLCIYYFCIIRLNMRNHTFKKIEPFLHAVPILYSSICGIFALTKQYYNNAGSVCYVAPSPITCEIFPDVECTRGEGASRFRLLFLTYPSMAIFVIVCIIMSVITYSVKRTEMRQRRYSNPHSDKSPSQADFKDSDEGVSTKICSQASSRILWVISYLRSPRRQSTTEQNTNENATVDIYSSSLTNFPTSSTISVQRRVQNARRRGQRSRYKTGEIKKQALLYVLSYVLSYGFVWAQSIYVLTIKKPPPVTLKILAAIFFPLQGFVNIFIYSRPHIVSLQRNFPGEYTWFQAFITVLKSGGDDPFTSRQRRSSLTRRAHSDSTIGDFKSPFEKSINNSSTGHITDANGNDPISEPSEGKLQTDVENLTENEAFHVPPHQSSKCNGEEEETNLGLPKGRIEKSSGSTNKAIEILSGDDDSLNQPNSESPDFDSKVYQSDSRDNIVWNGASLDILRKIPKHPNNPALTCCTSTDTSTSTFDKDKIECGDDTSSLHSAIPESLENIVREAEQALDDSLGEFLVLAAEIGKNKDDCDVEVQNVDSLVDKKLRSKTSRNSIASSTDLGIIDNGDIFGTNMTSLHDYGKSNDEENCA